MFNEEELEFQCPYCGESISMLIETLYGQQNYIEDCEVCCQPIRIRYSTEGNEVSEFAVERTD